MMDTRNGETTELYDGITITLLFLKETLAYSEIVDTRDWSWGPCIYAHCIIGKICLSPPIALHERNFRSSSSYLFLPVP